jgi:threonine dehydrogenase-like Zn-dependent dehydrogenase
VRALGINGVLSLAGVYDPHHEEKVPLGGLALEMVEGNRTVFGSVNANRRYFEMGLEHMAEMEARWPGVLGRFFTRRLTLDLFAQGLEKASGDIKTVVQMQDEDTLA